MALHLLKFKSDLDNEMFNYLQKFGYIPKQITKNEKVTTMKEYKNGILLLQVNRNSIDLIKLIISNMF